MIFNITKEKRILPSKLISLHFSNVYHKIYFVWHRPFAMQRPSVMRNGRCMAKGRCHTKYIHAVDRCCVKKNPQTILSGNSSDCSFQFLRVNDLLVGHPDRDDCPCFSPSYLFKDGLALWVCIPIDQIAQSCPNICTRLLL